MNFMFKATSFCKSLFVHGHSGGQSMFGTSNFGTEVTSAPNCGLRHKMLTSASSSIEILTSAPCKRTTCAEVNDLCRS